MSLVKASMNPRRPSVTDGARATIKIRQGTHPSNEPHRTKVVNVVAVRTEEIDFLGYEESQAYCGRNSQRVHSGSREA